MCSERVDARIDTAVAVRVSNHFSFQRMQQNNGSAVQVLASWQLLMRKTQTFCCGKINL